jgi:TldD protein
LEDLLRIGVRSAVDGGADYADARYGKSDLAQVICENGVIKSYEQETLVGIGIRVAIKGSFALATTSSLNAGSVRIASARAVKLAQAAKPEKRNSSFADVKPVRARVKARAKEDPTKVHREEIAKLVLDINRSAAAPSIKSLNTRFGSYVDERHLVSSEGSDLRIRRVLTGITHTSVAQESGVLERMSDGQSLCQGFEFIRRNDWHKLAQAVTKDAAKAARAKAPKAGAYPVVADPRLVGLFMHEALGHASEGDLVSSGASVLKGKLGQRLAGANTSIVDDGEVEGGFFVPYDDEGVRKTPTTIVDGGVLKTYLASRKTASELGVPLTGNGRAQDFENIPIVRMTNIYLKPGDMSEEELIEETKEGLLVSGRGSGGGQVDVGGGTFTFGTGPSYLIHKGEKGEMLRGSMVSGSILQTLRNIVGIGRKVEVFTGVFGGCGKDGQQAKVGLGGPHVRITSMRVGGTA